MTLRSAGVGWLAVLGALWWLSQGGPDVITANTRAQNVVKPAGGDAVGQVPSVSELPKLPQVERVTPAQPKIGLDSDAHLNKTPPRETKGLDLVKMGWSYNCMDCHKLLKARWQYDRPMTEHAGIVLQHGNNRFCLNCHHPTNRNAWVDYDGSEIAQENVVLLCAKCHGTTYRDWNAGVHGRRNGYWNAQSGPQTRLRCIQCHDPHSPQFKPLTPLRPPDYPARAAGHPGSQQRFHGTTPGH